MCGIIGFTGNTEAAPLLLDGLEKLEYRGYDSAGIAVIENESINIIKSEGKIKNLREKIAKNHTPKGFVGIGHTRWATHGKPSDENAHPHYSKSRRFAVVHNGIIENFAELKDELIAKGYIFHSETDTEVVAHLLDDCYDGNFFNTVIAMTKRLVGSYALGIVCKDVPDKIICVKKANPLIVAVSDKGNFIASDITAVLAYTRNVYTMQDDEVAILSKNSVDFYNLNGEPINKEIEKVTWNVDAASKGGYEHFMIKEIKEQPEAIRATLSPRITADGKINLDGISLSDEQIRGFKRIYITACGSAYHVGVVGKYVIEQLARIPVEVDLASEFRYRYPLVDKDTLVILISQSGTTADTLEALREAKRRGARTLSIVNVVGSAIATESDDVLYTWAGPEISVATTKAYSTQLSLIYLIAIRLALATKAITDSVADELISEIQALPEKTEKIFELEDSIQRISERYTYLHHAYFIGRNLDYAVALEASLKLKEISYIHSEAYAAGELKHGTISLIEPGTSVIALCCCERLVEKTISNAKEVMARGAEVLCITTEDNKSCASICDHTIYIPKTHPLLMPSLEVIPLQLLGYYTAKSRKCDIDQPRNLAKSVTVE
ncbi:MAG: glutamine--fructose-6-phosphate transaminase (isomerizing) [Oscillospiraceae bacterium]|nr:glutamine--fructose-6-phosphate transaminase (isomerizing) [Oscillospiraceae bacterium]